MLHTKALVEALGGKKVFKRRIVNVDQLRETVKNRLTLRLSRGADRQIWPCARRGCGSVAFAAADNRASQKGAETAG